MGDREPAVPRVCPDDPPPWGRRERRVFIGASIALVLLYAYLQHSRFDLRVVSDSNHYLEAAEAIRNGVFYDSVRLPFYPLLIVATSWAGDWLLLTLQHLMALACPFLVFFGVLKVSRNRWWALFFALIAVWYYDNNIYPRTVLVETPLRFLVTCWAAVLLLLPPGRKKTASDGVLSALICMTKPQFFYVWLMGYAGAMLLRALPWRRGLIVVACFALAPGLYMLQASWREDRVIHNQYDFLRLTVKQATRTKHRYRLACYPEGDRDVDRIRSVVLEDPVEDPWEYMRYVERYMDRYDADKAQAMQAFFRGHVKLFLWSLIRRPDRHLVDFAHDTVMRSLDYEPRKWKGHKRPILYVTNDIVSFLSAASFLFAVIASVGFLVQRLRGRLGGCPAEWTLFPLIILLYFGAIHFIEGLGGRHRLPLNTFLLIVAAMGLRPVVDAWRLRATARKEDAQPSEPVAEDAQGR